MNEIEKKNKKKEKKNERMSNIEYRMYVSVQAERAWNGIPMRLFSSVQFSSVTSVHWLC
jgi:hypothetical protein